MQVGVTASQHIGKEHTSTMPLIEQSERIGGAAFLGIPIFDFLVSMLDSYSRMEQLVKFHNLLPPVLTSPLTNFICLSIGFVLLYLSSRKQLYRVAQSASNTRRLVDPAGAEIASVEKPKVLLPVVIVFLLALLATPIVAIGYSLAYKGTPPPSASKP